MACHVIPLQSPSMPSMFAVCNHANAAQPTAPAGRGRSALRDQVHDDDVRRRVPPHRDADRADAARDDHGHAADVVTSVRMAAADGAGDPERAARQSDLAAMRLAADEERDALAREERQCLRRAGVVGPMCRSGRNTTRSGGWCGSSAATSCRTVATRPAGGASDQSRAGQSPA